MLADVDFFIDFPDGSKGILECKTTNYNCMVTERDLDKWANDSTPVNYEYQGRHYMADYEAIRKIVLQVMEERENGSCGSNVTAAGAMETAERTGTSGENGLAGLDEDALGDILQSLDAFKG